MFSSKVMNDESNEAASLTMIKVIKDKDEARAKDNQGKSGDITERLAALSREIDKVSAPSPSPASVPINSADSSHGSPPAQSSAEPLAASPQTDQDRTGKKPQYRGWRKAENPDDLLSYWASLRHGQKYPDRARLQTDKIGKSWPNCLLVNCDRNNGRMQLEYEFTQALRNAHAEQDEGSANRSKIDVTAMVIDWVFSQCQEVAMSGRPNHATEIFPTESGESNIRLIALPLSKNQQQIDFILCHLQEI